MITITGTASALVVTRRHEVSYDHAVANDEPMATDWLAAADHDADVVDRAETETALPSYTSTPVEESAHVGTNLPQRDALPPGETSCRFERERIRVEARTALTGLGFRPAEAGKAVNLALERLGSAPLEAIIREALHCCARH